MIDELFAHMNEISGFKVQVNWAVPKNQVWLVDKWSTIHKIINVGNLTDDISLCVGEMK